jgi:hypothetical protein
LALQPPKKSVTKKAPWQFWKAATRVSGLSMSACDEMNVNIPEQKMKLISRKREYLDDLDTLSSQRFGSVGLCVASQRSHGELVAGALQQRLNDGAALLTGGTSDGNDGLVGRHEWREKG